jgi:hypothetical protein
MQDGVTWLVGMTHLTDALQLFHWHLPLDHLAILDRPLEVDLGGDVQKAFNNFVKTGQVWAFLLGLALGYIIRTFTSFG